MNFQATSGRAITHGIVEAAGAASWRGWLSLRRRDRSGHALSYVGLFLFTTVLYFRPYEIFPALSAFSSRLALVFALLTLLAFVPTQWMLEGRLSARTREVELVLLLCVAALLSVPLAVSRSEAIAAFSDVFLKAVVVFIVMINVVRTERRLHGLLWLSLLVSIVLSASALNDYRLGNFTVEGYRTKGIIGAMFDDPNDMALHLVTMMPVAVALMLGASGLLKKIGWGACAALIVAGIVVTFSRGGFLGLAAVALVLGWKLGRRNPLSIVLGLACMVAFFAFAPGNYAERVGSIFSPNFDAAGSGSQRRELLAESVNVALRRPLFGAGMDNFHMLSVHDKPTHNAYTQVAAELGLPALAIYLMFMLTPLRRLGQIERETDPVRDVPHYRRLHYLAIGLQAGFIGFMVGSFFLSVAFYWFLYYLVGYAVCLRRIYETGPGRVLGRVIVAADGSEATAEDAPTQQIEGERPRGERPR